MTCPIPCSPRRSRKPRKPQEGAALLIVLFILMMATGTAVFALQSSQFEQRAAGSLHQATRAKYVAEAATVGVLALCLEGGEHGCMDVDGATTNLSGPLRERYGLPDWGLTEKVWSPDPSRFTVTETSKFRANVVDNDRQLGSAVASVFVPTFLTVFEKWKLPKDGDGREPYRLIVSTYGEVGVGTDVLSAGNELRSGHETISATRAYFDVR